MLSEPPSRVEDDGTQVWDVTTGDETRAPRSPVFIAGYASIIIKDKEEPIPHLVTIVALQKAMAKFMANAQFRNIQLRHTNVQVAEVIESHKAKDGKTYTTHVDENGFFIVAQLRSDIDAARQAIKEIKDGDLNSFSIAGEAIDAKIVKSPGEEPFLRIEDLELWEVTICEEGKNPGAKFVVVKQFPTADVPVVKALVPPRIKVARSRNLKAVRQSMRGGLSTVYKGMAKELAGFIEDGPTSKGLKNSLRKTALSHANALDSVLTDAIAFSVGFGRKIGAEYIQDGQVRRILKQADDEEARPEDNDDDDIQDLVAETSHEISEAVVDMAWKMVRKATAEGLSWMEAARQVRKALLLMSEEPEPLRFVKACEILTLEKQGPISGFTNPQLAARLATIINTVTSDSINFGMLKEYRDKSDIVTVEVLDDEFPTSCTICKEANGLIWTLGYAMRRAQRLEHPNCVRKFRPVGLIRRRS